MIHPQFFLQLIALVISLSFFISFLMIGRYKTQQKGKARLLFYAFHLLVLLLYFLQIYQYLFSGKYNASLGAYLTLFFNFMIPVNLVFYLHLTYKNPGTLLLALIFGIGILNIASDFISPNKYSSIITVMTLIFCMLYAAAQSKNKNQDRMTRHLLGRLALVKGVALPFLVLDIIKNIGQSENPLILERIDFFPFYFCAIGLVLYFQEDKTNRNNFPGESYPGGEKMEDFTRREREIARLIVKGFTNGKIAEELFISESTVKKHVNSLFRKTDVKTRQELTDYLSPDPVGG